MNKLLLALSISLLFFTACEDINTLTLTENQGTFILNKGDAQTSTLSRYDYEQNTVANKLFEAKNNGQVFGPDATKFEIAKTDYYTNGLGFIVFPQSDVIELMSMTSYKMVGTIDGLSHPNDVLIANEKYAYVSTTDGIVKVDIVDFEVTDTKIEVGIGADKLVNAGKYLYVANTEDGTVSVIDMSNDILIETLNVGGYPFDMAVDIDLNIWVYCNGDAAGSNQSLYVINRVPGTDVLTHSVEERVTLGPKLGNGKNALITSLDGRFIYFVYGKTYRTSVYDPTFRTVIHEDSEYSDKVMNSVAFDTRTRKLQGVYQENNGSGVLVIFGEKEESYIESEEYTVGINPIQITYNY